MSKTSAKGGRPRVDHIMTLDMAKEVAMIQRTPKGKRPRSTEAHPRSSGTVQARKSTHRAPGTMGKAH